MRQQIIDEIQSDLALKVRQIGDLGEQINLLMNEIEDLEKVRLILDPDRPQEMRVKLEA